MKKLSPDTEQKTFTCSGCGHVGHWLEEFPQSRCINCHAAAPEVQHEMRTMTAGKLARMWGAR